jgi:NADPH-dependent 2,4-dienoyl-CoA reductase/sulfur reductase-like enzyme
MGGLISRGMAAAASDPAATAGIDAPQGPRVCILGGGFGGLYTAVKLENLMWPKGTKPQVTLIDQGDRFVFKPLLYELLSGAATADEVAPPLSRILAPYPVTLLQARVAEVKPAETPEVRGRWGFYGVHDVPTHLCIHGAAHGILHGGISVCIHAIWLAGR